MHALTEGNQFEHCSLCHRSVIDVYGSLNLDPSSTSYGQGPTHELRAHDFDCDGFDEVIVTLRGPPPFQGALPHSHIQFVLSGLVASIPGCEDL